MMTPVAYFAAHPPTKELTKAAIADVDAFNAAVATATPLVTKAQIIARLSTMSALLTEMGIPFDESFIVADFHEALCKAAARQWVRE